MAAGVICQLFLASCAPHCVHCVFCGPHMPVSWASFPGLFFLGDVDVVCVSVCVDQRWASGSRIVIKDGLRYF